MTPAQLEIEAEELRKLLRKPEVQNAMRHRCEQDGHSWENCCSIMMQVYQQCQWCEVTR